MTHITIEKAKLEQWLEVLRTERDIYRENDEDGAPEYIIEAITAIKAALAQDEASSSRAAQEPVALTLWTEAQHERAYHNSPELHKDVKSFASFKRVAKEIAAMYGITTPQQRPWVGLVNKDKVLDFGDAHVTIEFARGALWAEAKLKEMNT